MRTIALLVGFVALGSAMAAAQSATPPTAATDITRAEFATILGSMNPDGVADAQIKVVDIGKYNVAVGILHRSGKAKQNAISHSQITEIYYVIDGAGTFVTGGTMVDPTATVQPVVPGPTQSRRVLFTTRRPWIPIDREADAVQAVRD